MLVSFALKTVTVARASFFWEALSAITPLMLPLFCACTHSTDNKKHTSKQALFFIAVF
jgi:hypothetical protein